MLSKTNLNQIARSQDTQLDSGADGFPVASDFFSPLNSVQLAAMDLYARGLNVIPLPRKWEVAGQNKPGDKPKYDIDHDKPSYIHGVFFTARLHRCGPECRSSRQCQNMPEGARFDALFSHCNIGVVLGRLSGNLTALDCDSKAAFKRVGFELDQRGIKYWAYTSARGGSYLVRLVEGEAANISRVDIPNLEIWGRGRYMVLPPSLHPSGITYNWVTPEPRLHMGPSESVPVVSVSALAWLGVKLHKEKSTGANWVEPDLFGLPAWTVDLSINNRKILAYGVSEGERHNKLLTAAYDLVGCGIERLEAESVFLEAAGRCSPALREREALDILDWAYSKDFKPARAKKFVESDKLWARARDWGLDHDWRVYGRKAQTMRAVFLACCERLRMGQDGEVFRASVREIADLAGFGSPARSARGLADLIENKIIKRVGKDSASEAALYRLENVFSGARNDTLHTSEDRISVSLRAVSGASTDTEKDVFAKFGFVAARVWGVLQADSFPTAAAIARAGKLNYGAVRNALPKLIKAGLITASEGIYTGEVKTQGQLELLSANLGTLGVTAKRKRKNMYDRERRANKLLYAVRRSWWINYCRLHEYKTKGEFWK